MLPLSLSASPSVSGSPSLSLLSLLLAFFPFAHFPSFLSCIPSLPLSLSLSRLSTVLDAGFCSLLLRKRVREEGKRGGLARRVRRAAVGVWSAFRAQYVPLLRPSPRQQNTRPLGYSYYSTKAKLTCEGSSLELGSLRCVGRSAYQRGSPIY